MAIIYLAVIPGVQNRSAVQVEAEQHGHVCVITILSVQSAAGLQLCI